jgi:hypothetical protein
MTSRIKVLSSIGAVALLVSVGFPDRAAASTADSESVDIVVTSNGVLSVAVNETVPFDDIFYSFSEQTVTGELSVTVTDERGTAAGWAFNIRATNFNGSSGGAGDSFPIGGLSLTHASTSWVSGNTDLSHIQGSAISAVSTTGQLIALAGLGSGNGEYILVYPGELTIPGDTLVDTYTSVVTVEAAAAPN